MKAKRLTVFSLQCTDEVKVVSRMTVTWEIWWLASAAEKYGERGNPNCEVLTIVGIDWQVPFPRPGQTMGREKADWLG